MRRGARTGRTSLAFVVLAALGVTLAVVPPALRPSAYADTAWADDGGERVPEDVWQARTDDYLAWATSQGLSPGSIPSVLAHAERHDRDPSFVWDSNAPDPSDYEARFQQLREFRDTGDFAINDYLFTLLGHRDQLRPDLAAAFEERILNFKYWWTEPTPHGIIDSQYYWTENHLIIYLANEFIAGQTYPDDRVRQQRHDRPTAHGPRAAADPALDVVACPLRLQRVALERVLDGGPEGPAAPRRLVRRSGDHPLGVGPARRDVRRAGLASPERLVRRHPRTVVPQGQDDRA